MADTNTTYLISGATRGIGKGLVEALLQRPNTTVVAGVRNPEDKNAKSLSELPKAKDSKLIVVKLIVVKLDSVVEADAEAAVRHIQEHGISHLDTVIANAGIFAPEHFAPTSQVPLDALRQNFEVNTLGPVALFKATKALLDKAKEPKFVVTTSLLGSNVLLQIPPACNLPVIGYGMSKAAINFFISKAHGEHANIILLAFHPGAVDTELVAPLKAMDTKKEVEIISLETSIAGYLKVLDGATREGTSGRFIQYDGMSLPW